MLKVIKRPIIFALIFMLIGVGLSFGGQKLVEVSKYNDKYLRVSEFNDEMVLKSIYREGELVDFEDDEIETYQKMQVLILDTPSTNVLSTQIFMLYGDGRNLYVKYNDVSKYVMLY